MNPSVIAVPILRAHRVPFDSRSISRSQRSNAPSAGLRAERQAVQRGRRLLGPSGSGKTTCLRIIAGFERPDDGNVELGGQDVTGVPPHERDVNTVFQDYALFPHIVKNSSASISRSIPSTATTSP